MVDWELEQGDHHDFGSHNMYIESRVKDVDTGELYYYVRTDLFDKPQPEGIEKSLSEKDHIESIWPDEDEQDSWEGDMVEPEPKQVRRDFENDE